MGLGLLAKRRAAVGSLHSSSVNRRGHCEDPEKRRTNSPSSRAGLWRVLKATSTLSPLEAGSCRPLSFLPGSRVSWKCPGQPGRTPGETLALSSRSRVSPFSRSERMQPRKPFCLDAEDTRGGGGFEQEGDVCAQLSVERREVKSCWRPQAHSWLPAEDPTQCWLPGETPAHCWLPGEDPTPAQCWVPGETPTHCESSTGSLPAGTILTFTLALLRYSHTMATSCGWPKVRRSASSFQVRNWSPTTADAPCLRDDGSVARSNGRTRKLWGPVKVMAMDSGWGQEKESYLRGQGGGGGAPGGVEVEAHRAAVHREVEVSAASLQLHAVPVLVVQQAAQRAQGPASPPAWNTVWGFHGCLEELLYNDLNLIVLARHPDQHVTQTVRGRAGRPLCTLGSLLDDQHWHGVELERRDTHLNLSVDGSTVRLHLHLRPEHPHPHWEPQQLSIGAELGPSSQHPLLSGSFHGCLEELLYNDLNLIVLARHPDQHVTQTSEALVPSGCLRMQQHTSAPQALEPEGHSLHGDLSQPTVPPEQKAAPAVKETNFWSVGDSIHANCCGFFRVVVVPRVTGQEEIGHEPIRASIATLRSDSNNLSPSPEVDLQPLAGVELLLVGEALLQPPVELLHALPQLLPVAAQLGEARADAGRLPRRQELAQRLGVRLQPRLDLRALLQLSAHGLGRRREEQRGGEEEGGERGEEKREEEKEREGGGGERRREERGRRRERRREEKRGEGKRGEERERRGGEGREGEKRGREEEERGRGERGGKGKRERGEGGRREEKRGGKEERREGRGEERGGREEREREERRRGEEKGRERREENKEM
ncbi:hypothetical protein CRUP_011906 [Coryphaenoides rupestris]|nr:hypothetical protein CRUP_011906 [Coryphaenoides rupestris]